MVVDVLERRSQQRARVNWPVEFTATSTNHKLIHEKSKLVDYSATGACLLTMSSVQVGMQLTLHISLPVRMSRPLVLKGKVVRVDENYDVARLFNAVAVRWVLSSRRPSIAPMESKPVMSGVN
ncbi:MAG: PilZ domain-containing protein [Acidobacteriota bacterium]